MKKLLILCLLSASIPLFADISSKLSGRLFMDGALYMNQPTGLYSGMNITDVRLAGKIYFPDNIYTKIDVGYANNKVSLKDAYFEYGKNGNYFRGGYMIGFFSMDQSSSTNDYVFLTGSNVAETFYPGRRVGLSYTRTVPSFYMSVGAFTGDDLAISEKVRQGYNMTGRVVWRPINSKEKLFHIGAGAMIKVPNYDITTSTRSITLASKGVTYTASPKLLNLTIDGVKSQFQANAECLFNCNRFFCQSEYMLMNVTRKDNASSYLAQGGYFQTGFLLKGTHYEYDSTDALPVMPTEPHSLLLVCRFNYTDMNSKTLKAGLQYDFSLGLNYYYNQNISFKMDYSRLWLDKYSAMGENSFGMLQSRIQIRF